MKKLLLLWLALVGVSAHAQQKVHLRVYGGTAPYTYTLRDGSGSVIATRTSSNDDEAFDYTGNSYSFTIADAAGKSQSKGIDAASLQVIKAPSKAFSVTFGNPTELKNHISTMPPGFDMPGLPFICADYFQESMPISEADRQQRVQDLTNSNADVFGYYGNWIDPKLTEPWQGIDNPLWDQEFDHVNNVSPGQRHPWDDIIREAYVWKNAQAGRKGIKVLVNFGRMQNTLSNYHTRYAFAFPESETQTRPDGVSHTAPGKGYYSWFSCASFASDKAKAYDQKCLRNFCKRFRGAINDGTVAMIGPWFDNSGEGQPLLTYRLEDGSHTRNLGDFSDVMRQKLAAHFAAKFNNNVAKFNEVMSLSGGNALTAFTGEQLRRDLLLNGPNNLQAHFNWFQMEAMSLFERDLKDYVYANVNLSRTNLWMFEVGGLLDALLYPRKSLNFNRRIRQQTRWIQIKSNNDINYTDYAVDQINSAKKYMGEADGMWEPSPGDLSQFNPSAMAGPIAAMKAAGLNLSAFIPPNAYERWSEISNATNLAGYTSKPAAQDDQINGKPLTLTIKFKDVVNEGKYEGWAGEGKIRTAYDQMRQQYPGKRINIYVDDSDIFSDYPADNTAPGGSPKVPKNVAMMGNSFTEHRYAPEIGWYWSDRGMAASAVEKDMLHVFQAKLKTIDPSSQVKAMPLLASGAMFENWYHDNTQWKPSNLISELTAMNADAIIIPIGENVDESQVINRNFKGAFVTLIQAIRQANPNMVIALTTSAWDKPVYDQIVTQVAQEQNTAQSPITLISRKFLADIFRTNRQASPYFAYNQSFNFPPDATVYPIDAVKDHPSDLGMQWHADTFYNNWIVPQYNK